ncbi:uncharacterized protein LOC117829958 isoform X1 [Notolabrus celidotus]|uniref:uncharacterized protein LOC117813904 n=1 Tax=Notolabrus celidotus TaxID=1203425 RepID=UPI00148FC1AE|nr:uncharacterized protein LOC117813904 [Notolabrus celidotus]XP_034563699.1 uncharacterized protein LOC117829958 isoform X1 [Notolabrus celidotus]
MNEDCFVFFPFLHHSEDEETFTVANSYFIMTSHNSWNELPFSPGPAHVVPQFWKGDFSHVFMGDGKEDFSRWCRRFEVTVQATPTYDEDSMAKLLPTRLGGAAFSYWDSQSDAVKSDYDDVKEKLKAVFGQTAYVTTFQSYINARTRLPGEALPVFAAEISRLVEEAFPTYGQNAKDGEKFRRFIAGIEPYLQLRCHEQGLTSLDAALKFAIQIETAHQASRVFSSQNTVQYVSQAPVLPNVPGAAPAHFSTSSPSLSVNSATSEDLRNMQKTLETLSERVEQLHLQVQRQHKDARHSSSDYWSHRRSPSPHSERGHSRYNSSDRNSYRRPSYDQHTAPDRSYGPSRYVEDRYDTRDSHRRSGSYERQARGRSPSYREHTQSGRSADRHEDRRGSHRSPSPGHVRFQSPSHTSSNKLNYK